MWLVEGARVRERRRWVYGADVPEGGGEVRVSGVEVDCCILLVGSERGLEG